MVTVHQIFEGWIGFAGEDNQAAEQTLRGIGVEIVEERRPGEWAVIVPVDAMSKLDLLWGEFVWSLQ